jgi:hypothetical protein
MLATARPRAETIHVTRRALEEFALERRDDGRLWLRSADRATPVSVHRCFPWSEPLRYISLQDDRGREVALIHHPAELDGASHDALVQSLTEATFVFRITRLVHVEDEIEIRYWVVETRQGTRRFQTRRDDWPQELPGGGLLIRDVAGDLYHVADPAALDIRSRKLLWTFADE